MISEVSFAREFCQANNYASTLWNRNRVQDEVYAAASEIKTDIFSAYMASYIPMTHERDEERCGGSLASNSPKHDLIGDHLADIMSKFHVKYTLKCIKNPSWNSNSSSFCADYRRVRQNNLNSLSAMLIASSTYLSSHMATSLSALLLDDKFWSSYPGHTISDSASAEIAERMREVRKYKKLYDKNNPFLAQSVRDYQRHILSSRITNPQEGDILGQTMSTWPVLLLEVGLALIVLSSKGNWIKSVHLKNSQPNHEIDASSFPTKNIQSIFLGFI